MEREPIQVICQRLLWSGPPRGTVRGLLDFGGQKAVPEWEGKRSWQSAMPVCPQRARIVVIIMIIMVLDMPEQLNELWVIFQINSNSFPISK